MVSEAGLHGLPRPRGSRFPPILTPSGTYSTEFRTVSAN